MNATTTTRYSVIAVGTQVYCTSQAIPHFEIKFNWNGKIRTGQYSPLEPEIHFTNGDRFRQRHSMVTKYPKYLQNEIHFALYDLFASGMLGFYEHDRDGNQRRELRYFDLLTYRATFWEIATVCRHTDPQRMADIFNRYHNEQPDRHYIDTSAANAANEIVLLSDAYCDQQYSYPNVSAKVRGKRVKGWQVGGTDTWLLDFIAPVHPQIPMTNFCRRCRAEIEVFHLCESCQDAVSL